MHAERGGNKETKNRGGLGRTSEGAAVKISFKKVFPSIWPPETTVCGLELPITRPKPPPFFVALFPPRSERTISPRLPTERLEQAVKCFSKAFFSKRKLFKLRPKISGLKYPILDYFFRSI